MNGYRTISEGRRAFFAWLSGSIAAFIGLTLAIPLLGYTILPALKRREPTWADAGPVAALQPGMPKELEVTISVTDGWQKTTAKKSIWALQNDDGEVTVYSPICPHLGCGYRWETTQQKFHCPCHHSFFAVDGTVVSGPAPRRLDTLPARIEDGRLKVIYREFKAGTAVKIAL